MVDPDQYQTVANRGARRARARSPDSEGGYLPPALRPRFTVPRPPQFDPLEEITCFCCNRTVNHRGSSFYRVRDRTWGPCPATRDPALANPLKLPEPHTGPALPHSITRSWGAPRTHRPGSPACTEARVQHAQRPWYASRKDIPSKQHNKC